MAHILELPVPVSVTADLSDGHSSSVIRTKEVYVVFTSLDETLAAIPVARQLSTALAVPLTLMHFRSVPYPLQVDRPNGHSPVQTDAFVERLRAEGIDARVHVYLCRDALRTCATVLRPRSIVVIGGRRRWWPTASERWRRTLEAHGHFVVFVNEAHHA